MCSEHAVSMVLIWAGMSSGPSVSWRHPARSGARRSSAVVRSASNVGSAFSWIVSDGEAWRMNSVTAPSRAPASRTNFVISAVRSLKPRPEVSIVSSDVTMVVGLAADGGVREGDLAAIMNCLSVVPAKAGTHTPCRRNFALVADGFLTTRIGGYGSLLSQGRLAKRAVHGPNHERRSAGFSFSCGGEEFPRP